MIRLFNTLTRSKEDFRPLKKQLSSFILGEKTVTMYNCGPTVYDYAHIGNLRTYVFADILRRTLEYNSYKVLQVINITDVGHLVSDGDEGEDKMTKALRREKKPLTVETMREVGDFYFGKFIQDITSLNIELPKYFPKATDHINEDIEIISALEKNGYAYKTTDGLYFDTSKAKNYGRLGGISLSGAKDGARVAVNPEKKSQTDFSLWKFNKELGWESPWGRGFPGWHIECSAMSRKYLGQPFDIHTGATDHISIHHNNEIAQSEAAYGKPLANYWLHGGFLTIADAKIAKSAGNSIILSALTKEGVSPLAYRYWLLTAHYRSLVNFTYEAVRAGQSAYIRLNKLVASYPTGGMINEKYQNKFKEFINDDLDLPKAVALTWDLIKDSGVSDADKRATILDFDKVFGLKLGTASETIVSEVPEKVTSLAQARESARSQKDWKKADELRQEIDKAGYEIKDSGSGYELKPR